VLDPSRRRDGVAWGRWEHLGEHGRNAETLRGFTRRWYPCQESNLDNRVRSTVLDPPRQGHGTRSRSRTRFSGRLENDRLTLRSTGTESRPGIEPGYAVLQTAAPTRTSRHWGGIKDTGTASALLCPAPRAKWAWCFTGPLEQATRIELA
jgi:hypothetical protein